MNDYIESYQQIAEGHAADSYEPSSNKQRVDLTEYYKETAQDDATMMVTGSEALAKGKFPKYVAAYFKLAGFESYDPFPSERNARAGQEGFFSTLRDGFKTFIENIIKYIRMAVDWVVDTVKGIFGFRKSSRINKAINDSLGDLKQEFVTTLSGLGFPATDYNLENFLQNLPPNQDRVAQLVLMKSKFETDQGAIDGLGEALPILQQCIAKLKASSDKVTHSQASLRATISKEYTKTRVRAGNPQLSVTATDSPEVNRLIKACLEVSSGLDTTALAQLVSKLYEVLYKVNFSNEELMNGFDAARKKIQEIVVTETVKLGKQDIPVILTSIQFLNMRYLEMLENDIDLSKVNFKNLGNVIDKTDADKIKEISGYYNHPQMLQIYQQMTVDVRNFSQFCYSVSQSLMVVERQIENLVSWYNRAHAFYYHGLLEDIDTLAKINLEARSAGHSPDADKNGYPNFQNFVFIKDADAKTFAEKASAVSETIISNDLGGVKTTFNNFAKQAGWGKLI